MPTHLTETPLQDADFNPPNVDRKGHAIEYYPPCPISRLGSTAPTLKKLMKTQAAPTIVT